MQAYILTGTNGPDSLQLTNVPTPTISASDVLVRVKAISLNPVDYKTARGKAMWGTLSAQPPVIDGWDIAGEVTEVGADVTEFKVGDAVFGMVNFPGAGRAYAEYVAAPADHLAHQPANISVEEAAGATLAALTAFQIMKKANVQAGQRVLVHAAGGGVGSFAVQFAKERGAYVLGTASAAKRDFVLSLGADEVIDYTQVRFEEAIEPVDFVFTGIGNDIPTRSLSIIKPGGKLISIAGGVTPEVSTQAQASQINASAFLVSSNGADQRAIADRLADGRLQSYVSQTIPFSQLPDALRQLEEGKTQGKIIVTV
ncbi:NADP-dependent oxidoreductase [Fibrella forsythiae]|uniref:NADP-dependent oxidoreductase n=1 Tax=Fibrella forsythiae TaxID=2817061 RepID=A0ABS3JHU4_9BACT|nr:NADP-dependent oxidoreductase [Fibrella forsythiae]MBO0949572.1 NADP-dependent oxidoreductase [Fibrella forsythiae]